MGQFHFFSRPFTFAISCCFDIKNDMARLPYPYVKVLHHQIYHIRNQMSTKKEKTALSMMGFVPALVFQHYTEQQERARELPAKQSFKSVVMFADISGFTNLTETLSKLGSEGAELTAFAINRYMELLVKTVSKSGGDIFKFAGDAMIVVWPPSTKTDQIQQYLEVGTFCRMAIQSALEIQARLDDTAILENIRLSVKIGFGVGDINIIYVGGVFGRSEYLATGEPLKQAFQSEHYADRGGQIIVSPEVHDIIKDFFYFTPVPANEKFFYVDRLVHISKVKFKAEALLIKNSINFTVFDRIKKNIMQYIPAALQPFIDNNLETWSSELRRVSTLFISLGIDLSDARTEGGLQRIQNVIKTVQKCVYMMEGSLNKLLMDDKGSTLIVVFGLPPVSHQNDAVRAVLTAFTLEEQLRRIKCRCAIGISTGIAFCGIVGTSGSRREYSILGDCVNLSARLMQMAMSPNTPCILIDEQTAMDAEQKVHSMFWGERTVKGKEQLIMVFEPMHPQDTFRKVGDIRTHYQQTYRPQMRENIAQIENEDEEVKQDASLSQSIINLGRKAVKTISDFTTRSKLSAKTLRTTQSVVTDPEPESPKMVQMQDFDIHRQKSLQNTPIEMVGMDSEANDIERFVQGFIDECRSKSKVPNHLLFVRGTYGIGKSFLVRTVLERMLYNNRAQFKYGEYMQFMVSILNPLTQGNQINSMRIVLRNIFLALALRLDRQPNIQLLEHIMGGLSSQSDQMDFLVRILGINNSLQSLELPEPNIDEALIENKKKLQRFTIKLVSMYLEQQPVAHGQGDGSEDFQNSKMIAPLIIVFDDMQNTDEISFYLIKVLLKYFSNICVIGVLRTQHVEFSLFKRDHEQKQNDTWQRWFATLQSFANNNKVVHLKGLHQHQKLDALHELIKKQFGFTQFALQKKQTDQPQQTLKNSQTMVGNRIRNQTVKTQSLEHLTIIEKMRDPLLYQESKQELFHIDLSTLLYNFLYLKSGGHPLILINLVNNLMERNFIYVDEDKGIAFVSEQFKAIIEHEEWLRVDVPLTSLQVAGPIIDRMSCLNQLLLKLASVIGEIFDLQTLYRIVPFKDQVNLKTLTKIIKELDNQDVIEFMDGDSENEHYRFKYPFIREVLYQRMTFSQRRQIHASVAEAFQIIPRPFDYNQRKEYKQLELHWFLANQKPQVRLRRWVNPHEHLTRHEKQQVVIKQIKQLLDRATKERKVPLKAGYILKRSEKGVFWDYRFCSLDSENFKIYSIDNEEEVVGDSSIVLPLTKLQEITILQNPTGMAIASSCWYKRNILVEAYRRFQFAFDDEEEQIEWTTFLDFAKTYAVYQDFVNNFGPISFPITFSDYDQEICTELHQEMRSRLRIGLIETGTDRSHQSHRVSRLSRFSRIKQRPEKRKSSAGLDSVFGTQISPRSSDTQAQDYQILKDRVKLFTMKSILALWAHLVCGIDQNLSVPEGERIHLGESNQFMEQNGQFFKFKY